MLRPAAVWRYSRKLHDLPNDHHRGLFGAPLLHLATSRCRGSLQRDYLVLERVYDLTLFHRRSIEAIMSPSSPQLVKSQ